MQYTDNPQDISCNREYYLDTLAQRGPGVRGL